jgi:hypothetical protein
VIASAQVEPRIALRLASPRDISLTTYALKIPRVMYVFPTFTLGILDHIRPSVWIRPKSFVGGVAFRSLDVIIMHNAFGSGVCGLSDR